MSLFDDLVASISGTSPGAVAALPAAQQNVLQANAAGVGVQGLGDLLAAGGTIMAGREAQLAARFAAAQLRQGAGQAQAAAQRQAFEIDRQTKLVASRALAVAAASGAGASDPTVVNLIAQSAEEGAYRRAVALYGGDDRARSMNLAADTRELEGDNAMTGATLGGSAKLASGAANFMQGAARGASLYQRFAGGGPKLTDEGGS